MSTSLKQLESIKVKVHEEQCTQTILNLTNSNLNINQSNNKYPNYPISNTKPT